MLCPESLTPQPVQEHLDSPRALLDRGLLCRVLKALLFHSVQKDRRFVAAGVGEDRLAAWREELRDEISEAEAFLRSYRTSAAITSSKVPMLRISGCRQSRANTSGSRSRFVRAL